MSWMLSCIGCGGKKLVEKEEAKVLDFQHYSLTSVPPYVFECERFLEELYLDFNQISELPRELFLCNELLILSLSDNDLHNLPPAISSLSNLTSLDLSKNGISDIPDSIKSCKRLRSVNASTNPLCRLPEGFTQLVALKELSLSDTFLEYLPANFGRLTGLEVLELRENQLNTLPRSFTRLTALKKLDLGQNEFTELPEVIGHLASLTDLWIDNNRVKRIPTEIGKLTHLTFLDASKNRINEIDQNIGNCKSLTHLYLTRNELEELPDSLCLCTKLSVVHVDDNHLDHLPEEIGRLDRMVELKTSQNEISYLSSSFGLLRSLQILHVDDNLLGTLPGELGSCVSLIVITAAHNNITELPAEMGSLGNLRVLNLCGNSLQNLPVSFTKLQLTSLWLSENQAKPLVPLQCTSDSGQKVLTCFMLPQSETQSSPPPIRVEDDRPLTEAEIEARMARSMIHFATDGDLKPSGRLTRVPTPYPKELRALAKHTKNILALRKEKEKGKKSDVTVANEEKPLLKAQSVDSSKQESSNSLVTMKSSSASVKVASNVASESVIKSPTPTKEDAVPEKVVTTKPLLSKSAVSSPTPFTIAASCQNYKPSVAPIAESRQITQIVNEEKENRNIEVEPVKANEPVLKQASPVKTSFSSSLAASNYPSGYSKVCQQLSDMNKSTLPDSPASPPSQYQSQQRPASIAVADHGSTPDRIKNTFPLRPGSLALEGSTIPPWHNKRPGSLAAPINTVGIPMTSPGQRSSSQNMINDDGRSPTFFGETWMPYQSPSQTPTKKDLYARVLPATREELVKEQANGETEESESKEILEEPTIDVMDSFVHISRDDELNVTNFVPTYDDVHQIELESPLSAGLVSTINRVTEEGSDEDRASADNDLTSPEIDRDKVSSKIPKIPIFTPGKVQSPGELSVDKQAFSGIPAPSKITLSPIGSPTTKIPQFPSSKIAQITSPKVLPEAVSSASGIQPPSYSYNISYSKVNPEKAKSGIPSVTSPVAKEFDFESKSQGEDRYSSKIPHKLEPLNKIPQREGTPPNKEIISPKNSSRIPTFGVPTFQPETKISTTRSTSQIEPKNSTIPVFGRTPSQTSQTDAKSPTAPVFARTPSQTDAKSPTAPVFVRSPSQISQPDAKSPTAPVFVRSPSQTDRESFIPIKRGDSIPKSKQPLSPVEKPINQTGIPILSPNDSAVERSSRIPSNSSLRGRKSGIPSLADKNLKPSPGGRRLTNPSS